LTLFITLLFTRSVQLIFPILLQRHVSKLSRYFWSKLQTKSLLGLAVITNCTKYDTELGNSAARCTALEYPSVC
jgi:hypothetical protein